MIGRLPLLRGRTRWRVALGAAAALGLLLALAPAELAPSALRAGAAACAIAAAAALARAGPARPATARRLTVVARQALSREAGVALVEVDGRAVLIGFGGGPVRCLQAGPRPSPEDAPPRPRAEVEP